MTRQRGINRTILIVSIIAVCLLGACAEESMSPPNVEKKAKDLEIHGDVRVDDYYWLRERENPDVIAYLEAENDYVKSSLADY